jgi:N-acetylmuramoyl-L-alanine amidase
MSTITRQLVQALRQRSATVVTSDEPDASAQAAAANRFGASVYLGFEAQPGQRSTIHYFAVPQFESRGGRALAELLAHAAIDVAPGLAPEVHGMRLTVLRETRMPAVLVVLGSIAEVLDHTPALVAAIVTALERWADRPLGDHAG